MHPLLSRKLKPSEGGQTPEARRRWAGVGATRGEGSVLQTWLEKETVLIISQAQLQKRLSSAADYK